MVEKEGLSSGLVHQHFLINSNLQHTTLPHQLESTTYNTYSLNRIYNIQHFFINSNLQHTHFFINSNLQHTTFPYQLESTTYTTLLYHLESTHTTLPYQLESTIYITSSSSLIYIKQYCLINSNLYNIQHFFINSNLQHTALPHHLKSTTYSTFSSTQIYIYNTSSSALESTHTKIFINLNLQNTTFFPQLTTSQI